MRAQQSLSVHCKDTQLPSILDDAGYELVRPLLNNDAIAVDQGDHGVGSLLHELDQVRVYQELPTVEPSNPYHLRSLPLYRRPLRRLKSLDQVDQLLQKLVGDRDRPGIRLVRSLADNEIRELQCQVDVRFLENTALNRAATEGPGGPDLCNP